MLSILPTKLTKGSSIARILQFSAILQVQERLPAQSNPSHEQNTLKLLISGFNKKLPKKQSKFTVSTLKIKLLISLAKVMRGHCLKNSKKDLDWYHERKCDLSFPSPAWLLYHSTRWTIAKLFKILVQDFVRTSMFEYSTSKIATSDLWKTKFTQFVYPASDSDLEEGVNEKQHHGFTSSVEPRSAYTHKNEAH